MISSADLIARIAIPSPLYRLFDYRVPDDGRALGLQPGMRVLVPFGRQRMVGILVEFAGKTDISPEKIKSILEVLDTQPSLDAQLLQLARWAAHYYHHPVGDALTTALPVQLRKTSAARRITIQWWELTETGLEVDPNSLRRAPRQAAIIAQLQSSKTGLPREELDAPLAVLRAMQGKGWLRETRPSALDTHALKQNPDSPPALNEDQQLAVDTVSSSLGGFQSYLLEGVTGSGKTEVYLRLISTLAAAGKQVLILVPEIGLTPQLLRRFDERLGIPMAVMHSGLNDSQRLDAWQRAGSGDALVVIGTRSAIFTPLPKPGLIIVDEEHDPSLKQQDGFRYSARDMAVWRARQTNVPVILGSATPSLESLYNVEQGRYRQLHLHERAGQAQMPALKLLDVRKQIMQDMLSAPLLKRMEKHLANGGQVLVFLNRRGYAPALLCHDCGWIAECQRCDARMTYHQRHKQLRCHHCGHQRAVTSNCPQCGSSELIAIGQGTERIEKTLAGLFPDYKILRIDRDTTSRKGALQTALNSARSGESKILVGTQMLAKGHHFPGVSLVAILDADQGLFGSDFRSSERMAQLIVQVAGRAGRGEQPGEVLIQTHQPDHPLLRQLVEHGYPAFARAALEERKEAQLPPFANLALLRAHATQPELTMDFLTIAKQRAQALGIAGLELWGPVPSPMERRAGRYRAQLMIQSTRRTALQQLLSSWIPQLGTEKAARKVRWSIDVDPQDML